MTMKPDPTESPAAPVSEGGGELVKQLKALHAAHQIRISEITDNGWFPMGDRYIEAMFAALAAAEERAKEAEVSLAAMLENFGGYNTPEVDAAIAHMQSVGLDVWSMQRVMEIQGAERKKIEARATRAESERDEALRALEPFARVGEVFLKTSDDILVPWGTPDGTRVDLFQASAVTREVITAGDMRRAALLSRLQSGNMRQQEVREQSEAERAPESGEGPV